MREVVKVTISLTSALLQLAGDSAGRAETA